jgi:hypothetical protein
MQAGRGGGRPYRRRGRSAGADGAEVVAGVGEDDVDPGRGREGTTSTAAHVRGQRRAQGRAHRGADGMTETTVASAERRQRQWPGLGPPRTARAETSWPRWTAGGGGTTSDGRVGGDGSGGRRTAHPWSGQWRGGQRSVEYVGAQRRRGRRQWEEGEGAYITPHICTGAKGGPVQMLTFVPGLLLPWYKCAFHFAP